MWKGKYNFSPQGQQTNNKKICSPLSRCNTAMGSSTGLFLVGPTKVKTHKSILFPEGSLKVEVGTDSILLCSVIYKSIIT